ncbi:Ferredoxin-dependent glutamate synthase 1 [compost metagenome]
MDGEFARHCNTAMVALEPLLTEAEQDAKLARELWHGGMADEAVVKQLVENHARYTASAQAKRILEHWSEFRMKFVKVFPNEYRRALSELAARRRRLVA